MRNDTDRINSAHVKNSSLRALSEAIYNVCVKSVVAKLFFTTPSNYYNTGVDSDLVLQRLLYSSAIE